MSVKLHLERVRLDGKSNLCCAKSPHSSDWLSASGCHDLKDLWLVSLGDGGGGSGCVHGCKTLRLWVEHSLPGTEGQRKGGNGEGKEDQILIPPPSLFLLVLHEKFPLEELGLLCLYHLWFSRSLLWDLLFSLCTSNTRPGELWFVYRSSVASDTSWRL